MSASIDNTVLIAYMLGDLPADQAAEVERAVRADPNLAAKLDFLGAVVGTDPAGSQPVALPLADRLRTRRWFVKRAAGVIGGAVALGGVGYAAGYRAALPPPSPPPAPPPPAPLLEDGFEENVFDPTKWEAGLGRREVRVFDGRVHLRNRGSIVTKAQFREPIELSFDWIWVDEDGDKQYSEDLCVALHTSGRHHPQHSFEITDGVVIRFSTQWHQAFIDVVEAIKPPNVTLFRRLKDCPAMTIPIPAVKWHRVRVTDDGKRIAVFFPKKRAADGKYEEVLVVETEYSGKFSEHRIAIYNRERVGWTDHVSWIDNLKVYRLVDR